MTEPAYFTLAEFQELKDCADFTEAKVLAAAAYFVDIVEREAKSTFTPQTATETFEGADFLILAHPDVASLTSVTVDGSAVNTALLSSRSGIVKYLGGGSFGGSASTVVVVYTYGATTVPGDIKDAVMWATRDRLLAQAQEAGSWDRKSSETSDFGTVNYVLPGEKRPTGYPDLDAVLASYSRIVPTYGFA